VNRLPSASRKISRTRSLERIGKVPHTLKNLSKAVYEVLFVVGKKSKEFRVESLEKYAVRSALTFASILLTLSFSYIYLYTPAFTPVANAAANNTINFQARLLSNTGALVPDGYYNAEFKLYDAASGGTLLWTDTRYDTNGVTAGNDYRIQVKNGYLTVSLADTSAGGTAFPGTIDWSQELWLSMNIGGTTQTASPTWNGEMSPRMKVTAVPYAFAAKEAQQLKVTNGANTTTISVTAPSANRTITFGDQSGTVVLDSTLTTEGDIYYRNGSGLARLARGSNGDCLTSSSTTILWGSCGAGGSTLQGAYDAGNTITTTDSRNILFTLADTATDSNFLVNIATSSTGKFAVQNSGTDIISVNTANGVVVDGVFTSNGNVTLGNAAADNLTFTGTIQGTNAFVFEGSSVDANDTTFAITNPTATRTITFQNNTGIVPLGTAGNTLFFTTSGATNVTLPVSGTVTVNPGSGSYLQTVPTSTGTNTISPTGNGVIALSVYSTSGTAATSLNVYQGGAASNITVNNVGATSQNIISLSQSSTAYTGTALLLNLSAGSGSFASGNFIDLQKNSVSQFKVDNAGAVTQNGSLTFAGASPAIAASTAATNILLNAGTTGQIQIGGTSTGDILLGGGSASTGCTVSNSTGVFACTSTINGATLTGGSLSGTAVNGLSVSAGTISAGTWQGAAVGAAYGGTGQTTYAVGDLLYASGATALSKLAAVASGSCLISQGVGVAPIWGSCSTGGSGFTSITLAGSSGTSQTINEGDTITIVAGSNITTTGGATDTVTVATVANPSFATSVTSPLITSVAGLAVTGGTTLTLGSTGAGNDIIIDGADILDVQDNAIFAGTLAVTGTTDLTGSVAFKKGTDYSSTGTINDANFGDVSTIRLSGLSPKIITGIIGGRDGEFLTIINGGTGTATLNNNDAGSSAGNRIITGTNSDVIVPSGGSVSLIYDSATTVWRVIGDVPGGAGAGVTTAGAIAGTNTNGLNISGNTINLTVADGTNGGALTAGAQTIGGAKTFAALITGQTGLTITGAGTSISGGTIDLNTSGANTTNINTGGTGAVSIGNGTGAFALNSSAFDVSTAGALSGITSISASGLVTSVGLTAGAGLIQGTAGLTITGTTNIGATAGNTTSVGNSTGAVTLTGSNGSTFVFDGVTLTTAELNRLDGKDVALLDVNDAVTTAITGVGTLTSGVWNGTAVGAQYGGTGQTTVTTGDLLYGSAANTWGKLAAVASGQCLVSQGVGVAPAWATCPSTGNIVQVPANTATNTITPTAASTVGLTVNGTSNGTGATALIVNQGNNSASGVALNLTNGGGTQTNGVLINRNTAGGTTTNLLNLTNTAGTATNAINVSGAFTNLINSSGFTVTNAGAVTMGGSQVFTSTGSASTRQISVQTQTTLNTNGDALVVQAATGNGTGAGGAAQLIGGNGGASNGTGGNAVVFGGNGGATNASGGLVNITAGSGSGTGTGGQTRLYGGDGGATGTGGAVLIRSGNAASGTAGNVTIDTGTGTTGSPSISIGVTSASTVTLGRTAGTLNLDSATWQRTAAGTTALNLSNAANTTLALQNSGAGVANLTTDGAITAATGLTVSAGGAAITGASTISGGLNVTSGSYTLSGSSNSASGFIMNGNTLTSASNTTQAGVQVQPNFDLSTVSGGTLANFYSIINLAAITGAPATGITNAFGQYIRLDNTANAVITNLYTLRVANSTGTGYVNKTGIYVDNITGGTTNTPLRLVGATGNLLNINNTGQAIFRTTTDAAGAFQVQNNATTALFSVNTSSGAVTLSSLSTAGIVTNTAAGVLGTTSTVPVANGGTGLASYTTGDLLYASGTTTIARLTAVAAGQCLVSNGVGAAPVYSTCPSTGGLVQVPASTAANTVTPTVASVVGLTVNGTSNATGATALIVNQSNATQNGQNINLTNTSGTQSAGLQVTRNGTGGTTTSLLGLTNTLGTATNGILFTGTITNDITSAAARNLTVTTGTTGALNLDTGTTGAINIGTNANAKAISIGNTNIGTSQTLTAGAQTLYFSDAGYGLTFTSSGANVLYAGCFAGCGAGLYGDVASTSLSAFGANVGGSTGVGGAFTFTNTQNSTAGFAVKNANTVSILNIDSTNGELEVGAYNGGTNPVAGKLVVANTTNANTVTIQSGVTSASYALTLPTSVGAASDCLKNSGTAGILTFGSCGSGSTLQGAYDAGGAGDQVIALDATQDSIIIRNPAASGSDSTYNLTIDQLSTGARGGLDIQSAGSGNLLRVRDTTATAQDVFVIANGGAASFRNQTNSTSGFQVFNAGGTGYFNVDTTNNRVQIGAYTVGSGNGQLEIIPESDTRVGLRIDGYSPTYSTNYIEVRNSAAQDVLRLQSNGNLQISGGNFGTFGTTAAATDSVSTLLTSGNVSGAGSNSGGVNFRSGTSATGNTGTVVVQSGNAAGGNSGTVTVDSGTATGTTGIVNVGTSNASNVIIGRTGIATEVKGQLTSQGAGQALRVQNAGGTSNFFAVDTTNNLVQIGSGTTTTNIRFYNSSNANTITLSQSTSGSGTITIPGLTGTMCLAVTGGGNCSTVNTGYLLNTTTIQDGNLYIRSSAAAEVTARVRGATSQTADIFQVQNAGGGTNLLRVGSSGSFALANSTATVLSVSGTDGAFTAQNSANSTTAFQIQNAAGTALFIVDTSTTETNIITNGDFEAGTTGWSVKGTGSTITQSTTAEVSGANSLSVATTGTANAGARFVYVPTASTTYTLTMYIRASGSSFSTINIGRQDVSGTDVDCLTGRTVTTTGFIKFTCTYTTGGTITAPSSVYIKDTGTTHTFYVDNVTLVASSNQGTFNPYGKLTVNGAIQSPVLIKSSDNNYDNALQVQNTNGLEAFSVNTSTGDQGIKVRSNADATLILEADVDNDGSEIGSPYVQFLQDAGASNSLIGLVQAADTGLDGSAVTNAGVNDLLLQSNGTEGIAFATNGAVALLVGGSGGNLVAYNAMSIGKGSAPGASYSLEVVGAQASNYIALFNNTSDSATANGVRIDLTRNCDQDTSASDLGTANDFLGFWGTDGRAGSVSGVASSSACNAGTHLAYKTNGADFAEYFLTSINKPEAYELVSFKSSNVNKVVERSTNPNLPIVGAVTTTAGFVGNGPVCDDENALQTCDQQYENNNALVSLVGQVDVKVNDSNGAISVGDPIGLSTAPGIGAKMIGAGYIVGYAMESHTSGNGQIKVLIRPQYYTPASGTVLQGTGLNISGSAIVTGNMSIGSDLNVSGATTLDTLTVNGDAVFNGSLTVQNITVANITVNGKIITAGNTPTAIVGLAAGVEDTLNNIAAPTVTITGNDTSGTITIVAGASTTADELAELTFNSPFTGKPRIVFSPANRDSAKLGAYYDASTTTATSFSIYSDQAPEAGKTYEFTYFIVQ
jgi:hypothetical protein